MTDKKHQRPVDRSYLSERPLRGRPRESPDDRKARQRDELDGRQSELKREAAERRERAEDG